MLADLQPLLGSSGRLDEQVLDFLIVDFEHGHRDLALDLLRLVGMQHCDSLEDVVAGAWHDSLVFAVPHDGVRFARAGLPVGEQACIITVESVVEQFIPLE